MTEIIIKKLDRCREKLDHYWKQNLKLGGKVEELEQDLKHAEDLAGIEAGIAQEHIEACAKYSQRADKLQGKLEEKTELAARLMEEAERWKSECQAFEAKWELMYAGRKCPSCGYHVTMNLDEPERQG